MLRTQGQYDGDTKRVITQSGEEIQIRHGRGKYVYPNKYFMYEGQWNNGQKHGRGTFTCKSGVVYEGEFSRGEIQGNGSRSWPDGSTYTGQFVAGEQHGKGVFVGSNGDQYEGDWERNQRHGEGVLVLQNGDSYQGYFSQHMFHGGGEYDWMDGCKYTGQWEEGKASGEGEQSLPGETYEGGFLNGLRHSTGLMRCEDYKYEYGGRWEQGVAIDLPTTIRVRLKAPVEEETDGKRKKLGKNPTKEKKTEEKKGSSRPASQVKKSKKQLAREKEELQAALDSARRGQATCEAQDPHGRIVTVTDYDLCPELEVVPGMALPTIYLCLSDSTGRTTLSEHGRQLEVKLVMPLTDTADDDKKAPKKKAKKEKQKKPTAHAESGDKKNDSKEEAAAPVVFLCSCATMTPEEIQAIIEQQQEEDLKSSEKKNKKKRPGSPPRSSTNNTTPRQPSTARSDTSTASEYGVCQGHCSGSYCITFTPDRCERSGIVRVNHLALANVSITGVRCMLQISDVTFPYRWEDVIETPPHPATLVEATGDDGGMSGLASPLASARDSSSQSESLADTEPPSTGLLHPACIPVTYQPPKPRPRPRLTEPLPNLHRSFLRPLPTVLIPFEVTAAKKQKPGKAGKKKTPKK